jgi:transposase
MSKKKHRLHSPGFKINVLKTHLVDQKSVSEVCEKYEIKPSLFYKWQKELFSEGELVFQGKQNKLHECYEKRIKYLEKKLTQKNDILAELMEEYVTLKKTFGGE